MPNTGMYGEVVFELDGRKLSHVNAGAPINYWYSELNRDISSDPDEQEDRVFLNDPELRPFSKYVRKIFVTTGMTKNYEFVESGDERYKLYAARRIGATLQYGREHGIPVVLVPVLTKTSIRDSHSSVPTYIHPKIPSLDPAKVLKVYKEATTGVEAPSNAFLERHDLEAYDKWYKHYQFSDIAHALHLLYQGWTPRGSDYVKTDYSRDTKTEEFVDHYMIYLPKFHNERRNKARPLLALLIKELGRMGLKSADKEELETFFRENFPLRGDRNPYSPPEWDEVEKRLPAEFRAKIESARKKLASYENTEGKE